MNLHFDLFSGRKNPSIQLPPTIGRLVFELINDFRPNMSFTPASFPARLGYRGLSIDVPIDLVSRYRVSPWLHLPADFQHSALLKELRAILRLAAFLGVQELQALLNLILSLIDKAGSAMGGGGSRPTGPCAFEELTYDPNPWNDPLFKPTNNCYAYASNKRARYSAKPQPGVATGQIFASLSGADVAAAARRDGAHDLNDCFPDSEAPRLLVALVIWPNFDYHWYRKHPTFWGHKPGATDARNVDNSGAVITNPETCDRGPYTEFTRYMLIPKSQKVAA